jgi:hypothetical protein
MRVQYPYDSAYIDAFFTFVPQASICEDACRGLLKKRYVAPLLAERWLITQWFR